MSTIPSPDLAAVAVRAPERTSAVAADAVVVLLFAAAVIVGLHGHGMWRDELQVWGLARESQDFLSFLGALRAESCGLLWPLVVYALSHLSANPIVLQILQGAIAIGAAALFNFTAPLPRLQKIALTFGYFGLFEYGLIAGPHPVAMLALYGACTCFTRRRTATWGLAVALGALALSGTLGAIVAVAFAVAALRSRSSEPASACARWGLIALTGLGAAAAIAIAVAPADYVSPTGIAVSAIPWRERIVGTLVRVSWAYFPMPNPYAYLYWNTNMFGGAKLLIFGLLALILAGALLARKRDALSFFSLGSLGVTGYLLATFFNGANHYGYFFLVFAASLWLAAGAEPDDAAEVFFERYMHNFAASWRDLVGFCDRQGRRIVTLVLLGQLVAGGFAYYRHVTTPFSRARATAAYLQPLLRSDRFVAVNGDAAAISLANYLDHDVFMPRSNRFGRAVHWDGQRVGTEDQTMPRIVAAMQARKQDCLLAVNDRILMRDGKRGRSFQNERLDMGDYYITELYGLVGAAVADENYYLYLVERKH